MIIMEEINALSDAHVSDPKHLSSQLFEICQSPDDSFWMKQTDVATFLCKTIISTLSI
jgi:hypothetical protein